MCHNLDQAVQVQALSGVIVLCSLARHFILTVPFSTQVYKWGSWQIVGATWRVLQETCNGLASHPGKVAIILPVASCYKNQSWALRAWSQFTAYAVRRSTTLITDSTSSSPVDFDQSSSQKHFNLYTTIIWLSYNFKFQKCPYLPHRMDFF